MCRACASAPVVRSPSTAALARSVGSTETHKSTATRRVEDPERAEQAYSSSTLPIDMEHRRVMEEVVSGEAAVELLYEQRRYDTSVRQRLRQIIFAQFVPEAVPLRHVAVATSHIEGRIDNLLV